MKKLASLAMVMVMLLNFGMIPCAASAEEPVELVFYNWGDGTEQKMFEYVFELFTKENPDVTVKYLYVPGGEYMTKLNTMAASDTMPDMGQMPAWCTLLWAENGMYADMSDLFTNGEVAPVWTATTII